MGNKATAVLIALVMALFALTGCTRTTGEVLTLYDGNGLIIVTSKDTGTTLYIKGAR